MENVPKVAGVERFVTDSLRTPLSFARASSFHLCILVWELVESMTKPGNCHAFYLQWGHAIHVTIMFSGYLRTLLTCSPSSPRFGLRLATECESL